MKKVLLAIVAVTLFVGCVNTEKEYPKNQGGVKQVVVEEVNETTVKDSDVADVIKDSEVVKEGTK